MTIQGEDLTTTFTWDYLAGQRASITGPDGLTTSWLYDPFGRLAQETRPGGSTTDVTYHDCASCFPQGARFFVKTTGSDGSDESAFFDVLQRPVGSVWALPTATEGRQEIRYDNQGQVERVSQPRLSADPEFWVTYQYDLIGRLLEEDAPIDEDLALGRHHDR